jgi:hypothetical protein
MSLQQTVPVLSLHYKLGFGKNSKWLFNSVMCFF